ncbi:MAG: septum formation initiator family protein [Solobacterium sp.]|nr:septum formation initiator family protein [Solobacterium sp.]
MTEIKTVKKKKKRKLTPVVKLLCIVMIGISLFFLFSFGREVMTTLRLRKNLAEVREKLQIVEDENTYLTDQKAKLQDPDYVESYARGNFMLSKDGEQIFYLPEKTDK